MRRALRAPAPSHLVLLVMEVAHALPLWDAAKLGSFFFQGHSVAHTEGKLEQQHLDPGPLRCVFMSPLLWFLAKALISGYSCRNLSSNLGRVTLLIRCLPTGTISLKLLCQSFEF